MAAGFKQQCPSCEAMVPIRDEGLIGRKIDCPKCKYRFVVQEPPDEEPEEDAKAPGKKKPGGKADKGGKPEKGGPRRRGEEEDRPKKKKGGGSTILVLGGSLAVVAVIAVGCAIAFWPAGGSPSPSPSPSPPMAGMPGGPGGDPGPGQGGEQPGKAPEEPPVVQANITNLLPNDAQVVLSFPMSATLGSALRTAAIDEAEGGFRPDQFRARMGFGIDDVNRVVTALNPKDSWIFTLLQTKKPYKPETIKAQLRLRPAPQVQGKSGKGYEVFQVQGDLDSLASLLLKGGQPRDKFEVHFYDSTTIVFADPAPLKKFLAADAKPEFLTKLAGADGGTPGASGTPGSSPMPGSSPPGSSPMPGSSPPGMASPGSSPPGMASPGSSPPGMAGPGGAAPAAKPDAPLPSSYLSVDPALKTILDRIEKLEENKTTRKKEPSSLVTVAMLVESVQTPLLDVFNATETTPLSPLQQVFLEVVEKQLDGKTSVRAMAFTQRQIARLAAKAQLDKVKTVGASLVAFDQKVADVAIAAEARERRDAEAYEKLLRPLLPLALPLIKAALGLEVTIAVPQQQVGMPGYGTPGYPPGSGSSPGYAEGSGSPMVNPMPSPGYPPGSGSSPGYPPGSGSSPGYPPGSGSPSGTPGTPGTPGTEPAKSDGTLDLRLEDRVLFGSLVLQLTPAAYDKLYLPAREGMVYLRGQADLTTSRPRFHDLARALQSYVTEKNEFPAGALPRPAGERGFPYSPDQRLSWVVSLLPYLGEEYRDWKFDLDKPWNEGKNQLIAARIVTPLLAHRLAGVSPVHVFFPGQPDLPVASTHFVAVAGLGLDAAEYAAGDAATAKKLGLFGNDRVTKRTEVRDGLDKTIAFLLVPGDHKAPWLAGGGATLRAIADEGDDPRPLAPFVCINYPAQANDKTKWDNQRGTLAIMADGRVRFLPEDLPPATFRALCTIAGGESLPRLDTICPVIEDPATVLPPPPPEQPKPPATAPVPAPGLTPAPGGTTPPPGTNTPVPGATTPPGGEKK